MDPNKALEEFVAELNSTKPVDDEAMEKAEALFQWLDDGGFTPDMAPLQKLNKHGLQVMLNSFLGYFHDETNKNKYLSDRFVQAYEKTQTKGAG